jgi:integrase
MFSGEYRMSVRKRAWTTAKGVKKEAWIVNYTDQGGTRRLKTFEKKKVADDFDATGPQRGEGGHPHAGQLQHHCWRSG